MPRCLGRVGLRCPYGRRQSARWMGNVLQNRDEWLRGPHSTSQMNAKVGGSRSKRGTAGRYNLLYQLPCMRPRCSTCEPVSATCSPYLDISHNHTPPFGKFPFFDGQFWKTFFSDRMTSLNRRRAWAPCRMIMLARGSHEPCR